MKKFFVHSNVTTERDAAEYLFDRKYLASESIETFYSEQKGKLFHSQRRRKTSSNNLWDLYTELVKCLKSNRTI